MTRKRAKRTRQNTASTSRRHRHSGMILMAWSSLQLSRGEKRFARVAQISKSDPRIWVAMFTLREGRARIISVRRAHKNEEKLYEQQGKTEDR
jgi:uncharacterized DUF497 family protein